MNGHAPTVDSPACPCWWVIKGRQQGVLPPLTIIRERGIFLDRERIQRAWTPPGCGTPSPAPATRSTPAFPSSAKRWASPSAPGRLPPTTTMTMSDFSPFRRPSADHLLRLPQESGVLSDFAAFPAGTGQPCAVQIPLIMQKETAEKLLPSSLTRCHLPL